MNHLQTLQTDRLPDIFMITDMQITNLGSLVRYFNECENRITVVIIGKNLESKQFRKTMALRHNVQIYGVENQSDILEIVLGKIREFF